MSSSSSVRDRVAELQMKQKVSENVGSKTKLETPSEETLHKFSPGVKVRLAELQNKLKGSENVGSKTKLETPSEKTLHKFSPGVKVRLAELQNKLKGSENVGSKTKLETPSQERLPTVSSPGVKDRLAKLQMKQKLLSRSVGSKTKLETPSQERLPTMSSPGVKDRLAKLQMKQKLLSGSVGSKTKLETPSQESLRTKFSPGVRYRLSELQKKLKGSKNVGSKTNLETPSQKGLPTVSSPGVKDRLAELQMKKKISSGSVASMTKLEMPSQQSLHKSSSGVKDRLAELQMKQKILGNVGSKTKLKPTPSEEYVHKFLARVNEVEAILKRVRQQNEAIVRLQNDILNNPFCNKKQILECSSIIEETKNDLQEVRGLLQRLVAEEELSNQKPGVKVAVAHVRDQQVKHLTISLTEATDEFFKGQARYMDHMKERQKKQLAITGSQGKKSQREIESILEGKDSYAIFTQNFISDVTNTGSSLREIEDRQKDILSLEKGVVQVNELFKDLNLLVAAQGETIDSIEANVVHAGDYTEDAKNELEKGSKYRRTVRRRKWCIAGIVIVALVIVVVTIVFSQ